MHTFRYPVSTGRPVPRANLCLFHWSVSPSSLLHVKVLSFSLCSLAHLKYPTPFNWIKWDDPAWTPQNLKFPDSHAYLYPYPSSLRSWRMVASRPVSPQCSWMDSTAFQKRVFDQYPRVLLLLVQVFPSFWFLFIITWPCLSSLLKPKTNKTSTILHASIYHCMFFLLMQTSGVTSIPFWHLLLSIQSSNRYNLALSYKSETVLILKPLMTSSLLKPVDSWFFLTWLL